jgi:hypothetical protein
MSEAEGAMDKRGLTESDICDLFISPAIQRAGWDPYTQVRREVTLTPGPVVVRGNVAARGPSAFVSWSSLRVNGGPKMARYGQEVRIAGGMKEFVGQIGTIIGEKEPGRACIASG